MTAVDYAALYADATEMKNHWWWRPGWGVGTRFYAWHLTLDGQDDLHRLVDEYQAALANSPHLDPVPRQWRHITLTGMGHVHDVPDDLRDAAIENVRKAVTELGPLQATFHYASIFPEAIALGPDNPEAFTALQNAAQAATAKIVPSADQHNPRYRAHVSAHYSNSEHVTGPVRHALDTAATQSAQSTFSTLDLIEMHRDHRMYEWKVVTRVPLAD